VRSGQGAARTILLLHIISARPSEGTYLPQGIYGARLLILFLQEQIKDFIICCWKGRWDADDAGRADGTQGGRVRANV
jgi:hypothetical protein